MKTNKRPLLKFQNLRDYLLGLVLMISFGVFTQKLNCQIVFSDTREQTEKEEMMQMFRKAQLISDTFYHKREDLYLLDIIYSGEDVYLFVNGYFDVYKWEYNAWKKLNKEKKGGYNFGSKKFEWNNRIFSFGGYGFWRHHGELIEFDPETGIWKNIEFSVPLPNFPMHVTDYGFRIIGDTCYEVDIDNNKIRKYPVAFPADVYSRDTYHSSKPESNLWALLTLDGQKFIYNKNDGYFYNSDLHSGVVPVHYMIEKREWIQFKNDSLIKWSPNGTIISTLKISEMVKLYKRFKIDREENNSLKILSFITLIFGVIACIIFWRFRIRKQDYKRESWQNDLIRKLLSDKMEAVNTEQLDTMLGIDAITPLEYRKYRRSRIIHEINEEFNIKYGKDLIIRYKDPEDGRRYLYRIANTGKA